MQTSTYPCARAKESALHIVGESEKSNKEERDVLEDTQKTDDGKFQYTATGDHSKQDLRYTQKPIYSTDVHQQYLVLFTMVPRKRSC